MPFTISHVAAVLPFTRPLARWRVLSATIIGSMVPDFGFLSPWRPARVDTHGAMALLTFCLPVGLLTFWMFQRFIKQALMEVISDAAYLRWRPFGAPADLGSLLQWAVAACGILLGALSHLIWDAFTHEGTRGVRMIPALDEPYVDFAGHHLFGTRLLQDVSSLVGLGVVFLIVLYGLRSGHAGEPVPVRRLRAAERHGWILGYAATAAVLAALSFYKTWHGSVGVHSLAMTLAFYAIAALRGVAASVVLVSLALAARLRANR